jgi:roadblock/LC7 domain-containing protein
MASPVQISPVEIVNRILPGVSHVIELAEDGKPLAGSSQSLRLPDEWWHGLEQFAGSLTIDFRDGAKRLSETNQTPYQPIRGWFYTGGDWGVCVVSKSHLAASVSHLGLPIVATSSGFVAAFFLTEHNDSKVIFDRMIAQGLASPKVKPAK